MTSIEFTEEEILQILENYYGELLKDKMFEVCTVDEIKTIILNK